MMLRTALGRWTMRCRRACGRRRPTAWRDGSMSVGHLPGLGCRALARTTMSVFADMALSEGPSLRAWQSFRVMTCRATKGALYVKGMCWGPSLITSRIHVEEA